MLSDIGPGWEIVAETAGTLDSLTRTWESADGRLDLHGFPVTDPPGVRTMFSGFASPGTGSRSCRNHRSSSARGSRCPVGSREKVG